MSVYAFKKPLETLPRELPSSPSNLPSSSKKNICDPTSNHSAIAVTPNSSPTRTHLRKRTHQRKRKNHDQVQVKYIHRVERILLIAMFLAFFITTALWAPSLMEKELIWNSLVNETNTTNAMSTFVQGPPAIDGNIYLYILPYPAFGSKSSLFDCYTLNYTLLLRCLAPGFVALILGLTGLALEIHDNFTIDEPFDQLALKVSIRQLLRLSFQYHMARHRESVLFQFGVGSHRSHRSLSPFGGGIGGIGGGSGKRSNGSPFGSNSKGNNHSPLRKTSLWGQLKKENGLSPSPAQAEPEENREEKNNEKYNEKNNEIENDNDNNDDDNNGNEKNIDDDIQHIVYPYKDETMENNSKRNSKNDLIMVTPASKLKHLLHLQILKYRRIVNRRRFRPSELIVVGGFFTTTAMVLLVFAFLTTIAIVYSL